MPVKRLTAAFLITLLLCGGSGLRAQTAEKQREPVAVVIPQELADLLDEALAISRNSDQQINTVRTVAASIMQFARAHLQGYCQKLKLVLSDDNARCVPKPPKPDKPPTGQ